jgi:hypothetical protein
MAIATPVVPPPAAAAVVAPAPAGRQGPGRQTVKTQTRRAVQATERDEAGARVKGERDRRGSALDVSA